MNRKLIRPNLADVKGKERDGQIFRERSGENSAPPRRPPQPPTPPAKSAASGEPSEAAASLNAKTRRIAPPTETSAEIYYYKKQIDSHTTMVIVLTDNEEIEGTIEWYDRNALKVNRKNAPNLMLLKHNIKYMFKAEDRES